MEQFLSLDEYKKIALKLIGKYRKIVGYINIDDQLIGNIIQYMSIGDWRYDEKKSNGKSREKIRRMYGIYGIRDYIKTNNINLSFEEYYYETNTDYNVKAGKKVDFLIKNSGLTTSQYNVINSYLEGKSIPIIAEQFGISYERCYKLYKSSVKKMKNFVSKGNKNV